MRIEGIIDLKQNQSVKTRLKIYKRKMINPLEKKTSRKESVNESNDY